MNLRFDQVNATALLESITAVLAPTQPLQPTTSGDDAPRPFFAWLIVCLLRQLERQHWLVRVSNQYLAAADSLEGEVPTLPDWRFNFHGRGLCLYGPGGEALDVDFYDDNGFTIDPFFFAQRVHGLKEPEFPEARLRALVPTVELTALAIRQLMKEPRLLIPGENNHVFRLVPELEALSKAALALPSAAWQQAAPQLCDYGPDHAQFEVAALAHRQWLLSILHGEETPWAALDALAGVLPQAEFAALCTRTLDERAVGTLSACLIEALDKLPGEQGGDAVERLLGRLSPQEHHPYQGWATIAYLLRRGRAREQAVATLLAFARVQVVSGYSSNPFLAELAQLAIAYAPEHVNELVRRALRDGAPSCKAKISATLAVLGKPWCHEELAAALADTTERSEGVYLCQALFHIGTASARVLAGDWLQAHPLAEHVGPGFTWEEVLDANSDGWFESELAEAQAWAEQIPGLLPSRAN